MFPMLAKEILRGKKKELYTYTYTSVHVYFQYFFGGLAHELVQGSQGGGWVSSSAIQAPFARRVEGNRARHA